jgi:ABC-2 type transport system ATP-binding protein
MLEVENLRKRYGDREAVRGVSFRIARGEVFGLLGPNGAGKTTTIGMIAGVLRPSQGSVRLGGEKAGAGGGPARSRLGLVPQRIALYPSLTAEENLAFFADVYGVTVAERGRRIDELLELAGLTARRADAVGQFSGGMKRRLNLVCGLVHRPDVLLLDEPTTGVDPQSRERIYDAVEELAAKGLALLLTTHYMEEAERLCGRLAVMDEGAVCAEGTIPELIRRAGAEHVVELLLARAPGEALAVSLAERDCVAISEACFRIRTPGAELFLPTILGLVASEGNVVEELRVHRPNLGDVFLRLTGKELRD